MASRTVLKAYQNSGYKDEAGNMPALIDSFAHLTEDAASISDVTTGTATGKFVTPASLQGLTASETADGLVELATNAETITGTDTARAVTPDGLQAKLTNDFTVGGATLTPGASDSGTCAIQLTNQEGGDLAVRGSVFGYLSDDANGDSLTATAPSGGIAIGTDGLLIPVVANKAFHLVSESDGDIDVALTEAGAATWYLVLVMPNGKLIASTAIAFTA